MRIIRIRGYKNESGLYGALVTVDNLERLAERYVQLWVQLFEAQKLFETQKCALRETNIGQILGDMAALISLAETSPLFYGVLGQILRDALNKFCLYIEELTCEDPAQADLMELIQKIREQMRSPVPVV